MAPELITPSSGVTEPQPRRRSTDRIDVRDVFVGGGKMAAMMRSLDWSRTPLGPVSSWSPTLRMMVRFLLMNRFPHMLWWGPEYIQLYNDPYRPISGTKHPGALGQAARECWPEVWTVIGPLIDTPFHGGPATWDEDIFLELNRHGFVEETHFTIAYSPVPDEAASSGIGGVLATVHEITDKVVAERRVVALRDLGARVGDAKTAEDACAIAARTLSQHDKDIPFVLLYLIDESGARARLAGSTLAEAADADDAFSPPLVDLRESSAVGWPFADATRSNTVRLVPRLNEHFASVPPGPWSDPPNTAIVVPIPSNKAHEPAGILVAGLSPRLAFDVYYQDFLELVRTQISSAIATARAYEEERKRAEALAEIDRAKTAFFSNVSHEFRTPLTLMLGPTEDLLAGAHGALTSDQRAQLELLLRNESRLHRLVNALLDFSRIEAGRMQACYEPVDLASFTRELVSSFRAAIERAGLAFEVECGPLEEPAFVDRAMWEQIVLNLLSNAFKFTFEGRVAVSLRSDAGHVVLRVEDSGVGVHPVEMPRLFERFHRVEGTRSRTHEGSGIGLALVQELVRLHGGTIRAESVFGSGTSFTVTIPKGSGHLPQDRISAPRTVRSSSTGAASFVEEALRWLPSDTLAERDNDDGPSAQAEARVLVVDDNADMRDYLRRILETRWIVDTATDGETALDAVRARQPDLILTDIMMPGLDGFGLLHQLRAGADTASIPVIMLSARAGDEARVEGLDAGAEDYLVKPFSARELVARVRTHLELARLRNEQVRARRSVETSEERFRAIFENAEVSLWEEDLTELKAWVDRLAAEHGAGLRRVLDANPDMVTKAIGLVRIRDVNAVTLRLFGASSKEEILGSLDRVFVPESRAVFIEELVAMAEGRQLVHVDAPLQTLAGDRLDVAMTIGFPPVDEDYGRVLVTLMDISSRKQTEREREDRVAEMERAVRFSEMFVGILGHDLRNPLSAITTAANLLETRADSERIAKPVARILLSADRMERMISQLLDFTRIRLGRGIPIEPSRVDLSEVARAVIDELESVHRCQIRIRVTGDVVGTWDRDRIFQMLSNLADNACRHGTPAAPVHIDLDGSDGDTVRLTVSNHGATPPDVHALLVDPLGSSGRKTRDGTRGLGLGVFITDKSRSPTAVRSR